MADSKSPNPALTSEDSKTTLNVESSDSPKPNDKPVVSQKGIENAKKRLRAFSIQKKIPVTPTFTPTKSSVTQQVVIGKLTAKTGPKIPKYVDLEPDLKRMPKPPKPGGHKRESYQALKERTLEEIEGLKRKMELAELGIPLGMIGPDCSDRAMPTNSMPPMKGLLRPAQLDEIIEEAKKARADGKQYKFDYNKFCPQYDNPFQPKKQQDKGNRNKNKDNDKDDKNMDKEREAELLQKHRDREKDDYYRHKWEPKHMKPRHRYQRDRQKYRDKKESSKYGERYEPYPKDKKEPNDDRPAKDAEVNLSEFLVCDSWSLENEDKVSPLVSNQEVSDRGKSKLIEQQEDIDTDKSDKASVKSDNLKDTELIVKNIDSIKEKLQPVTDTFKFEIDDDEDIEMIVSKINSKPKIIKVEELPTKPLYDPFDNVDSQSSSLDDNLKGIDDTFLESVINEIKEEVMSDEELGEKGFLVEYEMTPEKEADPESLATGSSTPEIESKNVSIRSDCSEGYNTSDSRKSMDSDRKSMESGYRSTDSVYKIEKHNLDDFEVSREVSKATLESLETWSFVLKICQPLLFRHDKNKCYRETKTTPPLWFTENPKICSCVRDRSIVYQELDSCKSSLVDRVYGCDQQVQACSSNANELKIEDSPIVNLNQNAWYPQLNQCLTGIPFIPSLPSNWETDESSQASDPPKAKPISNKEVDKRDKEELSLDKAYQRFMDAVLQSDNKKSLEVSASNTPTKEIGHEPKKGSVEEKPKENDVEESKKDKKKKLEKKENCNEDWSEDSEEKKEQEKIVKKAKSKNRKRKHSTTSSTSSESEDVSPKKKKNSKAKMPKKNKLKNKKQKIKDKKSIKQEKRKSKSKKDEESNDELEVKIKSKTHKKDKKKSKSKKQKSNKHKKKESSTSSVSTESSSESELEKEKRRKKKLKKKRQAEKSKKRKRSLSDEFDINILNNIKTERLTDDEKLPNMTDFSPRRQQSFPQKEIINVKELQLAIKQEVIDDNERNKPVVKDIPKVEEIVRKDLERELQPEIESEIEPDLEPVIETVIEPEIEPEIEPVIEPKEKEPKPSIEDINNVSQSSSQESSVKEVFEKDESHLRPSSTNSNFSFNDVLKSNQQQFYPHDVPEHPESDEHNEYEYRQNYDRFDNSFDKSDSTVNRIEVVKISSSRGEIKYDWRAGRDGPRHATTKPSRWGYNMTGSQDKEDSNSRQKPGQANIVLTGDSPVYPIRSVLHDNNTYKIETISSNRDGKDSNETSYDEAYADMYGASDRLQYGDCFAEVKSESKQESNSRLSLDDRIDKVLRTDEALKPQPEPEEQPVQENGILLNSKDVLVDPRISRCNKRVSFADGYKPGQDSDTEQPPKKVPRRLGAPWPVPAWHPDHVALWDALPPPPAPPGSPPPYHTKLPPPIPAMMSLQPRRTLLPFPAMPQHAMAIN